MGKQACAGKEEGTMKKKKRETSNGLKRERVIREITIVACLLALFWAWMLYSTRPATEENTYRCQETVTSAVADEDTVRHGKSFDVIVYADDRCYVVDLCGTANNHKSAEALARRFATETEEVSLMVWKRPLFLWGIFDYMYYHPVRQLYELQIVEATCGEETLWSLENHNAYQREQRVLAYICGGIISLLVGGWEVLNWKIFYPRRRKKKQKRSETL